MATQFYLVALGSNVRTSVGRPRELLARVTLPGCELARSVTYSSRPQGPSKRRFANAVALIEASLDPPALLDALKAIERMHGRRGGRRWGPRPLDLDIVGWSGGLWQSDTLIIPHAAFRERRFVLAPLAEVAANWRDPVTGLFPRQLLARLDRRRPRP